MSCIFFRCPAKCPVFLGECAGITVIGSDRVILILEASSNGIITYSCAAVDKISTDSALHSHSAIAKLLVAFCECFNNTVF